MVHEDVAQDRQVRIQRAYFAKVGFEGGAEALECRWGVQFGDFEFDLLGDQLALQVYYPRK